MAIKPIDYQVMVPKISEVSKVHSSELHKNAVLQQQQATLTQNRVDNTLKQVYSQDKVNEARITGKQDREKGSNKDRRKKREGNSKGRSGLPNEKDSIIDIRL